ncbi:MAG: hypothetical protein KatS3mg107_0714 [Gemmataceae bacterium]|nr:MAG: hypothetical protein KatS3mg107_0714 [Gemmataceae bacterium]
MLAADEIPEASDIAIVEEQDNSQQPGDEVPPFGADSGWENEDHWLVEDDQIVWYMPWFGDEDDGVGDILCDDTGTIGDVLPFMAEEDWDTYEVPNFPVFHPRGPVEEGIVLPILESLTSDWLSSMQDVTIEVTNFGIHGAGDTPIVGNKRYRNGFPALIADDEDECTPQHFRSTAACPDGFTTMGSHCTRIHISCTSTHRPQFNSLIIQRTRNCS